MSKPAKISPMRLRGRDGVLVQTPFDMNFVLQLKGMVPRHERWFNEHRKGWWVAEQFADVIEHLVRGAFGAVVVVDEDGHEVTHEHGEKLEQGRLL